ncbi:MAG: hypothetical protein ACRDMA_16065 [Solirubrobacterales bacterium]
MRAALVAGLLSVALLGCVGGRAESGSISVATAGAASQQVVVTADDDSLPTSCRPFELGGRLVEFSDALNDQDMPILKSVWGPGFDFFSLTGSPAKRHKKHFDAEGRKRALRYVRNRGGFRLRFTEVRVIDYDPHFGVSIGYDGEWRQKGRTLHVVGKGGVSCDSPEMPGMAMAIRRKGGTNWCPKPPGGAQPKILVVCAGNGPS